MASCVVLLVHNNILSLYTTVFLFPLSVHAPALPTSLATMSLPRLTEKTDAVLKMILLALGHNRMAHSLH